MADNEAVAAPEVPAEALPSAPTSPVTQAASPSGDMTMAAKSPAKAKSLPAPRRKLLDVQSAFTHSVNMPPRYTMRAKTSFGNTFKATETEPSGPLAHLQDNVMPRQPSWSMLARGSGIPRAPDQPGPGEYPIPSTLYGSHPALPIAGRVPNRTEKRPSLGKASDTPGPEAYRTEMSKGKEFKFGRYDQASAPKFTMRKKTSFGNTFKATETEPSGPLAHKYDTIMTAAPRWSMLARGSGIPKAPDQPGPGEYPIPGSIYGKHPVFETPGRVPISTTKRPSMGRKFEGPE
eukprot:TRINITY_DN72826_c0_g1_i1.p1 TRINITY_DN72826_c0_g1~~TRINITY_DN72826_c0_g1_i1.p1  ORF type:complete len:290 (+),score=39.26 TRINITY_DN72826_c0_g1_i1:92-961(+)